MGYSIEKFGPNLVVHFQRT